MSTPVRALRTARSAPNLKRGIKHTTPTPLPTNLLNSHSQYTSLSVQALKQECRNKGLKVSGRKADLIDRLASNDASRLTDTGIADIKSFSTKVKQANLKTPPTNTTTTTPKGAKKQSTLAGEIDKVKDQVDRIKLPQGWQMLDKKKKKPFPIPVPPDSNSKIVSPQTQDTVYTTPKPDDGKGASELDSNVHVLGQTRVRDFEDEAKVQEASRDGSDFKPFSGDKGGNNSNEQSDFTSRDKTFFAGFAAVVTGWWALGKFTDKKKSTE